MNVEYFGHHYSVDDGLRQFTEGKLRKVLKFLDEPIEIRITIDPMKHGIKAEVHIAHRHGILQATEEHADLRDAINLAVDKIETQAHKSKDRFIDRRRRADRETHEGQRWAVNVLAGGSLEIGEQRRVVKSSHLEIKPMTIEEAALELDGSKNEFVVFRESTTDKINVLYRRKDANFGLITAEL